MSERIVELDQIDEREFDLGQEDEQQFDLGNPETVIITGVKVQDDPIDGGVAIYNEQDNELKTVLPDSEVTEDSDNLVTSGAVYDYVQNNGGKIDSISVNGVEQEIDQNKNVDITVPTQASDVHALPDSTKYGASLDLANGSTLQLKDQDGNDLGSPVTISTEDTGATSVEVVGSGNAVTDASYSSENRKITLTKGTEFQTATDNSLNTDAKNVVSAINEVNTVAKNANIAKGFTSYSTLITDLNSATATAYKVGQSFYVQTLDVPDLWVISVEASSVAYTYTTDSAFETATAVAGGQQVGYYKLGQLETQKTDLTNYVQKTTTIAGVDLQDNIPKSEMLTALNVEDGAEVNDIVSISAGGTALTPDADKNVNIPMIGESSSVGLVRSSNTYGTTSGPGFDGILVGAIRTGEQYKTGLDRMLISKGTLENAFNIKGFNTLTGSTAPTTATVGVVGQLYIDTTNNKTYQCIAINEDTSTTPSTYTYTWTQLIRASDTADNNVYGVVKLGDSASGFINNQFVGLMLREPSLSNLQAPRGGASTQQTVLLQNIATAVKYALCGSDRIGYYNNVENTGTETNSRSTPMTSSEQETAQSVLGIQYGLQRWV